MAELHRLLTVAEVEREASEWIARLNADDVSAEDRARFEAWRKAHPRRARAYDELSATWRQFTDAGQVVRAVALGNALSASTHEAIRQSTAADSSPSPSTEASRSAARAHTGRFRRALVLATAASLAALAVGGWWLGTSTPRTLFQTAIGERASIELPDGSSLELNSNSLARVDYSEQARVIRLVRGEAFFRVEHDTARPFWVVADRSWVRAVGTAFNVYVLSSGVRVTVSEGTVKVAASSGSTMPSDAQLTAEAVSVLTAGEQVDVSGTESDIRSLPPVELTRSIAWRTGTLHFENKRLAEVVDELSRYTTMQIVVEGEALRDLPVGGSFQSDSVGAEALLTLLQDGFGLQVRRDGRTAYIEASADPATN